MKIRLKLARIGMNMEEGTIAKWRVAVGADFEAGDALSRGSEELQRNGRCGDVGDP